MIPLVGVVSFRRVSRSRSFRLWVPLFLLWLLLLPFAVLGLPILLLICLFTRVSPLAVIAATWAILTGLKDTHIEVDNREALVLIRIL